MFRTKTARTVVGFLLLVLFNFACFWSITGDPVKAVKGILALYFAIGGLATTWFVVDGWIRRGEA